MEYYRLLNLSKEPFSNSPDPEFFYQSREHVGCLQKLELSVRLRRGLNVVIGDIGTGKTTLCRQLIRELSEDANLETHLILDPHFVSPSEFLAALAEMFGLTVEEGDSDWQIKETIKNHLFTWGVDEKKIMVLVIDEGQKTSDACLEILRELLNYETNDHKLLQIVIFAQTEFHQVLARHRNFADRINYYHVIKPLNFRETRSMLRYRLEQAKDGQKVPTFFTGSGLLAIYRTTGGYPRRIIHLCHRVLMTLIITNRTRAGWSMVHWCSRMLFPGRPHRRPWKVAAASAGLIVVLAAGIFAPVLLEIPFLDKQTRNSNVSTELDKPSSSPTSGAFRAPIPLNTVESAPPVAGNKPASEGPEVRRDSMNASGEAFASTQSDHQVSGPEEAREEGQILLAAVPPLPPPAGLEVIPQAAPEAIVVTAVPPDHLGSITIRIGDSLEQMIRRVYGVFDQQVLKAVLQFNPQITDSNNIDIGRVVLFPPLPVRIGPMAKSGCWVRVAERNTLEDAYQLLRTSPRGAPPMVMLPRWNPQDGLRFAVLLRDCCADEDAAESVLRKLPMSLASSAETVTEWDEDVIFVAK